MIRRGSSLNNEGGVYIGENCPRFDTAHMELYLGSGTKCVEGTGTPMTEILAISGTLIIMDPNVDLQSALDFALFNRF